MTGDFQSAAKARARVSQACTPCRNSKMRCDGLMPTCSPCADRSRHCIFPITQRTRGPGKSKQRLEALEARLAAIESGGALQQPANPPFDSEPEPLVTCPPLSAPISAGTTPHTIPFMGIPAFKRVPDRLALSRQEEYTKPLERVIFSPLVAEPSETFLLQQTIVELCTELPFLHIPHFVNQLQRPDTIHIPDAAWQGLLNAVIARAVSFKIHKSSAAEVTPYSWMFFRNAYAVLPELVLHGDSVGAAQAVMAMTLFMRQSADTRTTARLLSMAARMRCTAAPYAMPQAEGLPLSDEEESRRRLSLAAFVLDMEIAVNSGLPAAHAESDITGLANPPAGPALHDVVFHARVELAQIQHRVAAQLANPTRSELIALESDLEAWSLRVPLEIRPDWHYRADASATAEHMDVTVATLHMVYYNSLCMVCWALVRLVMDQVLKSGHPEATDCLALHDRTSHHRNVARATARAVIRTMLRFPIESFASLWTVISYPLAASIALLAVVCKEPDHPDAQTDVSLLGWFAQFLAKVVRDEGYDLERMRDGVFKFQMVASDAIAAALGSVMPVNPSLWPLTRASGETGKAMSVLMTCSSYVPMYLAQALIGNTPNRDTENTKKLTRIFEFGWGEGDYGPFAPDSLIPAAYGFSFRPSSAG